MKSAYFLMYLLLLTSRAYADGHSAFLYNEHGKMDPFAPLVTPRGDLISYDQQIIAATVMNLEGLLIDAKGNNWASVNGKIVKVNDQVEGYKVETIANDHVDLIKGQERLTIKLKKGGV
jgi:hypothetical protein